MGSQLIKGYSIQKQSKGNLGTNSLWKMYDGTKQGTNQLVTIFLIEKKAIKKSQRQQIIKFAKKQASTLAKFRHPGILSISEMPIEDQLNIAFVTERVEGNLQLFIKNNKISDICSSELEIRINLFQILETINFIHSNVKQVHLSINPESIYVTPSGKWKIAGFIFTQPLTQSGLQPYQGKQNNFSYYAPEMIRDQCCFQSDSFSTMILTLNLIRCVNGKKQFKPIISASSKQEYEKHKDIILNIENHPYVKQSTNSSALGRIARDTLQWDPEKRISIGSFARSQWLNDNFIITIKHLQNISNLEQKRQLDFIKGLSDILFKFEITVIKKRIIPCLLNLLKFDYLIAGIIVTLTEVMKKQSITVNQFQKIVWPHLKNLTQGKQIPAHALYVLVDSMDIFSKFLSLTDLASTIVPLCLKCFDCPNPLKQLALRKIEFLSKKYDYQFLKTKILPRLMNLLVDKSNDIRKYTLIALYKIHPLFDVQTINDTILSGLQKNKKMGIDPFTNAITLKLYVQFSKNLSIEVIGNKIIPNLIPYLVDTTISKNDFDMYKSTITTLMNRIQDERIKNFGVSDGIAYTELDFEFPKEAKKEAQQKQRQNAQPNFDFLSAFQQNNKQPQPNLVNNQNNNQKFNNNMIGNNINSNNNMMGNNNNMMGNNMNSNNNMMGNNMNSNNNMMGLNSNTNFNMNMNITNNSMNNNLNPSNFNFNNNNNLNNNMNSFGNNNSNYQNNFGNNFNNNQNNSGFNNNFNNNFEIDSLGIGNANFSKPNAKNNFNNDYRQNISNRMNYNPPSNNFNLQNEENFSEFVTADNSINSYKPPPKINPNNNNFNQNNNNNQNINQNFNQNNNNFNPINTFNQTNQNTNNFNAFNNNKPNIKPILPLSSASDQFFESLGLESTTVNKFLKGPNLKPNYPVNNTNSINLNVNNQNMSNNFNLGNNKKKQDNPFAQLQVDGVKPTIIPTRQKQQQPKNFGLDASLNLNVNVNKPTIKKPTKTTSNVANIKGDDFFDLL